MNQQLNSISEFIILVPSSYENGSSSLLYYPNILSQLNFYFLEKLNVMTYSFLLWFLNINVLPKIFPQINCP
jgi:hypothetical protein